MVTKYETHISLTEPELVEWVNDRVKEGNFKPSFIFRDAVKEKKQMWDTIHSQSPRALHERIAQLKHTLKMFSSFIENKREFIGDDWVKWVEEYEGEEETPVKETEEIVEDHSKDIKKEEKEDG